MIRICFENGSGENWPCFRISTRRCPRFSWACVALSRSLPNCEKAASSRYCASSSFRRASDLPHGLDLRAAADPAYRQSYVHRGTHALIEQIGFEINLSVGDRNDIGRNVGGNVAGLGFNDRQSGKRSAAVFVAQLRRRVRASESGDRTHRRDTLHVPAAGATATRFRGTTRHASKDHRR